MFIKTESDKALHFNDYDNIFHNIQNFLTLAINTPVYPLVVKGENKNHDIFMIYSNNKFTLSNKINPFTMFNPLTMLTFQDISDNFEQILNNWFAQFDALKRVYNLYFSTFYNKPMCIENEFLNLIYALEAYHRRKYGGNYLSEDEYKNVIDNLYQAIPANLNKDLKEKLESNIKYSNEISLRTRLKQIFKEHDELLKLIIDKNFINDIIITRNYWTHYDKNLEIKAKKGTEIVELVDKIKWILKLVFLKDLGVSVQTIKKLKAGL